MKKIFLLFILVFGMIALQAQTINGKKISDIKTPYIQILGVAKIMSQKVTIFIDYGQKKNIWKPKKQMILDENNKPAIFYGMIDALNFMTKYGYEFVTAYAYNDGGQAVYHYLLRKKNYQKK